MELSEIQQRIKDNDNPPSSLKDLGQWVINCEPERDLRSVDTMQVGDTFFYKVVGGKRRPWVVLKKSKGILGAASLTHDGKLQGAIESKCRLWQGNWIGPTLIQVEEDYVKDFVYYPYTNRKHLTEIRKSLVGFWT